MRRRLPGHLPRGDGTAQRNAISTKRTRIRLQWQKKKGRGFFWKKEQARRICFNQEVDPEKWKKKARVREKREEPTALKGGGEKRAKSRKLGDEGRLSLGEDGREGRPKRAALRTQSTLARAKPGREAWERGRCVTVEPWWGKDESVGPGVEGLAGGVGSGGESTGVSPVMAYTVRRGKVPGVR